MMMKGKEGLMGKGSVASISPLILGAATLLRLGWFMLSQNGGLNLANLWHYWLLRLVIGA